MRIPGAGLLAPRHVAAVEDHLTSHVATQLQRVGWVPRVIGYTGYGGDGWVRVLARVLVAPRGMTSSDEQVVRGWTRFAVLPTDGVTVRVTIGGETHEAVTGDNGYLDARLPVSLPPGWHEVSFEVGDNPPVRNDVRVVGPATTFGLVSDIDDTVIVTQLPRPLVAFRNTFLLRETDRRAVPGMADLYAQVLEAEPDAFVVYVSTGAWNVAGVLRRFLRRNGFPAGPMLLTDWGPRQDSWWRSGREHKRKALARLFSDFPGLSWLLVGDDGQHDVTLYGEAAAAHPGRVLGIAIRELSATEQMTTHGSPVRFSQRARHEDVEVPEVRAPDGAGLAAALRRRGIVLR